VYVCKGVAASGCVPALCLTHAHTNLPSSGVEKVEEVHLASQTNTAAILQRSTAGGVCVCVCVCVGGGVGIPISAQQPSEIPDGHYYVSSLI